MEKVIVNNKKEFSNNKVFIDNRNKISITGVNKVISSNSSSFILDTSNGKMLVDGENLHIDKLSVEEGVFEASGVINAMKYAEKNEGLFKRLFK